MFSKEIVLVAAGSLVAGSLFGYLISSRWCGKKSFQTIFKSYEDNNPIVHYVTENSLREPKILEELRVYTQQNVAMSLMLTDPLQAQFFRLLLNMLDAKKCIEVGTYTGYNALNCALALPSDGMVYALDISEEYVNHGKPFFEKANVAEKIDIRIAPAGETMDQLISQGHAGTFDFVYIDADKPGYDMYYEKGLMLVRKGGLIVLDNMLQHGKVVQSKETWNISTQSIDKLNKKIKSDNRVQISFFNLGDGVTFCRKL
ncbi:probable caffeoyl-CoA O-methyltransferase 2 [Hydractinia symbiolongicarpus]|uniref:probable caffeoyl-CoA O-methyltransferase 2 n=1 Tax=Hydractinia symbiolongicarpus TaxID=13093 RepID=UPI00254C7520|nr:probable caffeoyl-CoA O-methyltransferase 2 [Hydractinia symbiolongicarpus]